MNYYGYGVNLKDVRSAMEMSQLAYSYYNSVMDSYEHSDSDLAGYFSEHENDFLKIDYLSYTFKVSDVKNADTSTDTDTSADTDTSTDTAASTDTPETADSTSADTETSADTSTDTSGPEMPRAPTPMLRPIPPPRAKKRTRTRSTRLRSRQAPIRSPRLPMLSSSRLTSRITSRPWYTHPRPTPTSSTGT